MRPSVASLTAQELKNEVTAMRAGPPGTAPAPGCYWFTNQAIFGRNFWGGTYTDDNGTMVKGECHTILLYMDATRRASWRLGGLGAQPDKTNLDDLEDAIDDYNQKLEEHFEDIAEDYTYIDIAYLKINFFADVMEENSQLPLVPLILSYLLVGFLVSFALANFQLPSRSHAGIGLQALGCVALSMAVGGGLIGWAGIAWSPASIQCLPFLAIGLGVNDMFVLILALAEHGQMRACQEGPVESLATILSHGGLGVTLTSVANTFAFGIGAMIPVMGVADFCLGVSCVAASNFFIVMTVFACFLYADCKRMIAKMVDPSCVTCVCQKSASCKKELDELDDKSWGLPFQDLIAKYYVPLVMNPIFAIV